MEHIISFEKVSKKVKGTKKADGVPFIILLFKLCIKYKIGVDMIKSLHYNDLLYLVLSFQKDDIEQYLDNQKEKSDTVELSPEEATMFLTGKPPKKEV